jgi:hypothetical protein
MDTTPLQPLNSRWPNDKILAPTKVSLSQLTSLFTTPKGTSYFQKDFRLDPADSNVIAQFASANGLLYSANSSLAIYEIDDHYPAWRGPRIATTTQIVAHEVKGKLFGYDTTFTIEYLPANHQTESGTELNLTYRGVIRISLPKMFPQIVIDSNKNDKSYVSTIPTAIEPQQKLTLEGNFAEYFDLYAPMGLQNKVLTLLAPNFMQILMDSAATFDVEFYGNEMILTTHDPLYTSTVMNNALAILQTQLTYIDRLLNSWNYQPKQQPFDYLSYSYINGDVIKIGSFRLYPKQLITLILLGFLVLAVLIMLLNHFFPSTS